MQPIVPSGGTLKVINDKIEKIQHDVQVSFSHIIVQSCRKIFYFVSIYRCVYAISIQGRFDESQVLTNLTLCYFTGDDILTSHLMFNDRWKFDRYNLKGLKTYANDLTFGANIHLGK